ncbi:MAG: hypothetical protein AAF915_18080 [Cyanobacteria bacterium P01_D01_bin.50]
MTEVPGNYRTTKLQKYENPPITTTEGLQHGGGSSIYLYYEHNFNTVATGHVVWAMDMLANLPSSQKSSESKISQQAEIQRKSKISDTQRRIPSGIRPFQKTQKNLQEANSANTQKIKTLEANNGVSAL